MARENVAEALGYKPEDTELDGSASERLLATLFRVIHCFDAQELTNLRVKL